MANSDRTQKTATQQLENIKVIETKIDELSLSPRLREVIQLRKTYPDASLSELSEYSEKTIGRYISKSGLSHCFKDLENLALAIKK
jgi:DNA-binding protein WhiA